MATWEQQLRDAKKSTILALVHMFPEERFAHL